jgi:hypothetical protein
METTVSAGTNVSLTCCDGVPLGKDLTQLEGKIIIYTGTCIPLDIDPRFK